MLDKKAAQIRLDALLSTHKAGLANVGEMMSSIEILVSLFYGEIFGRKAMLFDPNKPQWDGQDYFVLSKINSTVVLYSILADLGFFDKSDLDFVGKEGSALTSFPNGKIPGVSASVPDHGYGLSVALGLALSLKMDKKENKVYTVLSEKELLNGQVWEAARMATSNNLSNLIAFVDYPMVQVDAGAPNAVKIDRIQDKFEAFGWGVMQVTNGHDFDQILTAVERSFKTNRRPVCIWVHTVAGKGIEFAERKPGYFNASLSDGEMSDIIPKLEKLIC